MLNEYDEDELYAQIGGILITELLHYILNDISLGNINIARIIKSSPPQNFGHLLKDVIEQIIAQQKAALDILDVKNIPEGVEGKISQELGSLLLSKLKFVPPEEDTAVADASEEQIRCLLEEHLKKILERSVEQKTRESDGRTVEKIKSIKNAYEKLPFQ
ncbi:hypothetical protein GNI_128940 [Gregarina niphandrodes]|uniref:Uncharacterized protein n=1 Tax=Gregarina niphandrodes TaxID=110365 RepID=A0A023B1P0_GRENI|nr:hypothetical protein GNI_128940 [Gregarina niphandrodes]EZG48436.1 hypothetical protein GNI_128940 [Gregarina niphandrodes]|eukprot:XP_011132097.1 hypothetical protein GNI_128940 [Gregarina niphandrodes]